MLLNYIYEYVKRINPTITKEQLLDELSKNDISAISLALIASPKNS